MELSQALVLQSVIRDWEKPPYSVEGFLGTRCGRIRTLISYQLCSALGSSKGMRPTHWDSEPGSLSVEFKADSSQVLAILHFPGSHPSLWILRTAENLWLVCIGLEENSQALENSNLNYFR